MPTQSPEPSSTARQALLLSRSGQWTAAEALCRQLLALQPAEPTALFVLGACLLQRGDFAQAEQAFSASLRAQPGQVTALANRGIALQELQRHEEAMASLNRALAIDPGNGRLYGQRARLWSAMRRFDRAIADFDRAISLGGEKRDLLLGRATALRQVRRVSEALTAIDRVLSWTPDDREALDARAAALIELHRWDDARQAYEKLLAVEPDDLDALASLAGVFNRLDRPDEALAACDRILAEQPAHVGTLNNRATALLHLGRIDEAVAATDEVIAIDAENAAARSNRARIRLTQGRFAEAWPDYEYRWRHSRFLQSLRTLPEPLWDGRADIAGKTILLHAEQGLGDTIHFARYVPLLAARGARVLVGAQRPLKPLLETLDGVSAVIVGGEELPPFDLHCPLLSLPALLNTTLQTIPSRVPYLRTDGAILARWGDRLGPKGAPRIGLAWSGNPTQADDIRRSLRVHLLTRLVAAPAEFFCLSKVVREPDLDDMQRLGIKHFGREQTDFAQTAALTALMDLVISVDTSVAHLAGALGRPLWILLSHSADFRWLLDRDDSPWYPTARLFRQPARGAWDTVIAQVERELDTFLAVAAPSAAA